VTISVTVVNPQSLFTAENAETFVVRLQLSVVKLKKETTEITERSSRAIKCSGFKIKKMNHRNRGTVVVRDEHSVISVVIF
jgi:hypothetical protein